MARKPDTSSQKKKDPPSASGQDDDMVIETGEGCIFSIEVSPGSKTARFPDGYNPWRKAFGIAVKAQPVEGKANKAIIELIAQRLDISKNNISIISGQTSSVKKVQVSGISRPQLLSILKDE